jgi:hypothetical protein
LRSGSTELGVRVPEAYGIPYPTVMDDSGDIHNHLGFVGLPDTVFYASDGSIART